MSSDARSVTVNVGVHRCSRSNISGQIWLYAVFNQTLKEYSVGGGFGGLILR